MSNDEFKEPAAPARGLRRSSGRAVPVIPPVSALSTAMAMESTSQSPRKKNLPSPRDPAGRSDPGNLRQSLTRSEANYKGGRHNAVASPKKPLPHGSSVYSPRWIHAVKRETDKQVQAFLETLAREDKKAAASAVVTQLEELGNQFLRLKTDLLGSASKAMVIKLQTLLSTASMAEKSLVVQLLLAISSCSRLDEYIQSVREAERGGGGTAPPLGATRDRSGYDGQMEYQKTESPRLRDSQSKRANFLSQSLNGDDMEAFIQLIPTSAAGLPTAADVLALGGGGAGGGAGGGGSGGVAPAAFGEAECEYVMCRMCEKMVEKPIYDGHVQFCSQKVTHDIEIISIDQQMAKLLARTPQGLEEGSPARALMERALAISAAEKGGFYECNQLRKDLDALAEELKTQQRLTEHAVVTRCSELIQKKLKALQSVEIALLQSPRLPSPKLGRAMVPNEDADQRASAKIPSILDFEILKPITRGGYGGVYLARKKATSDLYAIKALNRKEMVRRGEMKSIFAERNILATVQSEYVVKMFFAMASRKYLFFVMEFMCGGDCFSLLRRFGRFDEQIAKFYVAEVILALEDIHAQGVIHRDLKPDNILISANGHVKLADFGLSAIGLINKQAREGDEPSELTIRMDADQGAVRGTPHYLAPEILLGLGHDQAIDFWAVGVILFEFCNGYPPFNGATVQEVFAEIFAGKIGWPSPEHDEMSDLCKNLILKLLENDPSKRLNSATRVKAHPFFVKDDPDFWLTLGTEEPPFVPSQSLTSAEDTSHFDERVEFFAMDHDTSVGQDSRDVSSDEESDDLSSSSLRHNDSASGLATSFWHINVHNLRQHSSNQ